MVVLLYVLRWEAGVASVTLVLTISCVDGEATTLSTVYRLLLVFSSLRDATPEPLNTRLSASGSVLTSWYIYRLVDAYSEGIADASYCSRSGPIVSAVMLEPTRSMCSEEFSIICGDVVIKTAPRIVTTIVSLFPLSVVMVMYGFDVFATPKPEFLRLKLHPLPPFKFCERHSFEWLASNFTTIGALVFVSYNWVT